MAFYPEEDMKFASVGGCCNIGGLRVGVKWCKEVIRNMVWVDVDPNAC